MHRKTKIILIQLTAIGDTLMCEPALSGVRRGYPNAEITFLTSNAASPILENNPHLDKLIIWKKKTPLLKYIGFLLSLSIPRYEILVDFQKNPRTYVMAHFIRAKRKISFAGKYRNFIYDELAEPFKINNYVASEKFRMISSILPQGIIFSEPKIYITEQDRARAKEIFEQLGFSQKDVVVAVSPVSKVRYRSWQSHNYSRLCDYLFEKYHVKFIFTWGPGEKHMVDEVIDGMQSHRPNTDYTIDCLKVLYGIFELSDMYLGNNNGPRHMAIAAGIPTMCIFGHFYYRYWTPPNNGKHAYVEPKLKETPPGVERIDSVDYNEAQATCERLLQEVIKAKSNGVSNE